MHWLWLHHSMGAQCFASVCEVSEFHPWHWETKKSSDANICAPSVLPQLKKKVKMQNHKIPKSNTIGDKLPLRMPRGKWVGTWTTRPWEVSSHEERIQERKAVRTFLTPGSPNRCSLGYLHLGRCQGLREVLRVPGPLPGEELPWMWTGSSKLDHTEGQKWGRETKPGSHREKVIKFLSLNEKVQNGARRSYRKEPWAAAPSKSLWISHKKKKNEHRVRSKSSLIVERTRRAGGVAQM